MNGPRLRHLLWKDWRSLRSLVAATLIAPPAITLVLCLACWVWRDSFRGIDGFFGMLFFFPGLMALGVAPMLVGTENEERTYDWLRRLPVAWWQVLLSKLIVGVGVVLTATLWTGFLLVLSHLIFDFSGVTQPNGISFSQMAGGMGAYLLYVSLGVMTCGFFTAFLIRNALASALAVIPLVVGWIVIVASSMDWYGVSGLTMRASVVDVIRLVAIPGLVHVFVIGATIGLARRRFQGPSDEHWRPWAMRTLMRPVALPLISTKRPSVAKALVWQHVAQNQFVFILIVATTLVSLMSMYLAREVIGDIAVAISIPMILANLGLGVCTFHGDQKKPRRNFFADRGLPPTLIWWTRMIGPATVAILLLIVWVIGQNLFRRLDSDRMQWAFLGMFVFQFLIGASTGQWFRRGSMAFFVAPAVAYFAAIAMAVATLPIQDFIDWKAVTVIGVLSFAALLASTWHVNQLWLRGREGKELTLPALAWIGLPILLVGLCATAIRVFIEVV